MIEDKTLHRNVKASAELLLAILMEMVGFGDPAIGTRGVIAARLGVFDAD